MTASTARSAVRGAMTGLLVVLGAGLAVGAFFVLRYLGLWSEQDTSVFVRTTEGLIQAGSLTYQGAYTHGFAYPLWVATLAGFVGLPVAFLISTVLPVVSGVLLAVTAYVAFSAMLGSRKWGTVAAGVLFLVPELVFTVMRGNHEKLTVSLTLLMATALLAGFLELSRTRRWRVFAGWVLVQYLSAFTLASVNSFFGSSFIIAITLCLVFALALVGLRRQRAVHVVPIVRRLVIVSAASWGVVALVLFFVYTPAADVLRTMATAAERLTALALSLEPESDPYAVTARDWANMGVYHALSSFRWVLLVTSFGWWLSLVIRAVREPERVPLHQLYLIALFGALGFQLAMAVPVDLVGLDAGSNLQVRLFTYFSVIAAPMFVSGLTAFLTTRRARTAHRGAAALVLSAAVVFGLASLAKATLDPTVSNRWLFYRPAEVSAMHFWEERHSRQTLWTDPEGRLRYAYTMVHGDRSASTNTLDAWTVDPRATHALRSEVNAASAVAWRLPPSTLWTENRTYDNGGAQVFHRIPRTPFQR